MNKPFQWTLICAACFAIGLFVGHRSGAATDIMPSNRPATQGDISQLSARIDDINSRLKLAGDGLTNAFQIVESQIDQQNKKLKVQYEWLNTLQDALDKTIGTNGATVRH